MVGVLAFLSLSSLAQSNDLIHLQVDATDAARNRIAVKETIPAKPGPFLIRYPKWLPGHHSASGTIANVIEFHVTANGKEIPWKRDGTEMFDIHVDVPSGADSIQVSFVDAMQTGREMTSSLGRAKFCELIFLPKGNVEKMNVKTTFKAPNGWTVFDALPVTQTGSNIDFPVATAERLIDSPVMMGQFARSWDMGHNVELDVVADGAEDLALPDDINNGLKKLVEQIHLLWGAHHFRTYHWLLSLSNYGAFDGLEHNECSEDGSGANTFLTPNAGEGLVYLLAHEMDHSWCGKYRRPADLYQTDYATPQGGSLLWVYEGMDEYWGDVLSARSGLWSPERLQETFAQNAASNAYKSGRTWRSTEDTAAAASILRNAGAAWGNARRAQDYYLEGTLVWVGADAIIRKQTNDKKSLDDFCKIFGGGPDTGPEIKPFTYQEIVRDLNAVTPYDWDGYLKHMVYDVHPSPTTEGLEAAGWKLMFNDQAPTPRGGGGGGRRGGGGGANLIYEMGITVDNTGVITDMAIDSPADKGGLGPNQKIVSVYGKDYTSDVLTDAIKASAGTTTPIEFKVTKDGVTSTVNVDYHDGMRYPHLVRIDGATDYLTEIGTSHP